MKAENQNGVYISVVCGTEKICQSDGVSPKGKMWYRYGCSSICSSLIQILNLLFILLTGTSFSQENSVEKIGWKGEGTGIVLGVVAFFFAVIIVLLIFYFKNKMVRKKEQKHHSEQLFKEFVEKAELTHHEIDKLDKLTAHIGHLDKHLIFQSILIFEQCIERDVQRFLNTASMQQEQNDENLILTSIRKKLGYNILPSEYPLTSSRNIEVGQKVSIFVNGNKQSSQGLHATVTLNQQFNLRVQIDSANEDRVLMSSGDIIKLAFARQCDGIYGIDMKVISYDGESIIELEHTLSMKRNQLRQFLRIEVNLPIKTRIVKTVNDDDKLLQGKQFEAKLVDISGGGLSFILDRPLVPGEILSMNFNLGEFAFSGQAGRVLRVSLVELKTSTMYRHHVTFIDIGQSMREKIVKYVFEKQRQLNQWR